VKHDSALELKFERMTGDSLSHNRGTSLMSLTDSKWKIAILCSHQRITVSNYLRKLQLSSLKLRLL